MSGRHGQAGLERSLSPRQALANTHLEYNKKSQSHESWRPVAFSSLAESLQTTFYIRQLLDSLTAHLDP